MKHTNLMLLLTLCYISTVGQVIQNLDSRLLKWDSTESHFPFQKKKATLLGILYQAEKSQNKKTISNCYRRLGIIYYEHGILDTSSLYCIKAVSLSEAINDHYSSASNYNQLGIINYTLKIYPKALFYFKKSHAAYQKIKSYRGISDATINIAEIYGILDSIDSMYEYSQISLHARIKSKDTTEIGYNYNSIGQFYQKVNNTDSALKYHYLSINSALLNKDSFALVQAYNEIGKVFLSANKYDKAIFFFSEVSSFNFQLKNTFEYVNVLFNLSDAYLKKKDFKNAYKYLFLGNSLNDSLKTIALQEEIVNANTRYETTKKDLDLAKINREYTELENHKEKQTLWVTILISIIISIVIISGLIIWVNYNKRRLAQKEAELQSQKVNDLLQKQEVENVNAMLKGQDAERKRIAQELHDRLGSILSTVKLHFSAVEEQMNALKQQQHQSYGEATLLLDEAVDEVRRISHDLYEGSLAKFGFKTALLQLIAAIEKANTVKILFIDNGVDEGIYKNHAQELYRITQELLSNTLKYSGATEITLQLSLKENTFGFMYEDNGKGFDKKYTETGGGIGYKNIAARVAKLNGNWHLDTHPGHGMTLLIEIPV